MVAWGKKHKSIIGNIHRIYLERFSFLRGQEFGQELFSPWPQYVIFGNGISRSNHSVRAPSLGGGSNAPRLALTVLHVDANADRR